MLSRMASISEVPANSSWERDGGDSDRPAVAKDERAVATVLQLAAASIGAPLEVAAVAQRMEANGVRWAWQLQHCSVQHWAEYGASHGLETAVRQELRHPAAEAGTSVKDELFQPGAAEARLRQFLLLPGPDGKEPPKLGDPNAPLMTLLTVPPADRQKLMLTLCV